MSAAVDTRAEAIDRARGRLRQMVLDSRKDPNVFIHTTARVEGNKPIREQAVVHKEWQDFLSSNDRCILFAPVGHGKALPLDTEIATPNGWRQMGALQVGDMVIGGDGVPTKVVSESNVYFDRDVYELSFDDGTSVCADADHQWSAWTVNDRDAGKPPRVATTREIVKHFKGPNGRMYWKIPLAGPSQYPAKDVSIHPYVLGAWLGNGTESSSQISCNALDESILDRCIELENGACGKRKYRNGGVSQVVGAAAHSRDQNGLRGRLRACGVLGNKHIPECYLWGSIDQRRDLLAGLLDTDGHVNRIDNRIEFSNTNLALAQEVLELARSLGFKVTLSEGIAKLDGRLIGPKYRVCWSTDQVVFFTPRKGTVHAAGVRRQSKKRKTARWTAKTITSWQKVKSVPVKCISVAAAHRTYVATRQYILTHNSSQIQRWRLEWEIGRNPELRVGVFSVTQDLPAKFLSSFKADVEHNPLIRRVYPGLKPSVTQRMWTGSKIVVQRRSHLPDPTIQICGAYGHILGSRLDLIIIDDLCNMENTLTQYQRDKLYDWLSGEVLSRLPPDGSGRVWALGHPWHEQDPLMRLARNEGYSVRTYASTTKYDKADDEEEEVLIPELWDLERLHRRAKELGPINSDMMLWCRLPSKGAGRIRREWFDTCLQRGRGLELVKTWDPANAPTYTGVDLGFSDDGSKTAVFTVAVMPEGSRRLLDLRSGRWTGPEIVDQLVDTHNRYGSIIAVESNAAQKMLLEFASQLNTIPLRGHLTSGKNKHHPTFGVEALGLELSQGRWILPCDNDLVPPPEVLAWIGEALSYSPDTHMGDRLSASWICRECIRKSPAAAGGVEVPDIDSLLR